MAKSLKEVLREMGMLTEEPRIKPDGDCMDCDAFDFCFPEEVPQVEKSRAEVLLEGTLETSLNILRKSPKEIMESIVFTINDNINFDTNIIDVEYINEETTILTYFSDVDDEEDVVMTKIMPGDIFSKEAGLTICVLKAIKKEVNKILKML